jgi:hypothetical protein
MIALEIAVLSWRNTRLPPIPSGFYVAEKRRAEITPAIATQAAFD